MSCYVMSWHTRGKKKKVRCVETGEIFPSLTAAGKSVGLKMGPQSIWNALRHGVKAGGYTWKLEEDEEAPAGVTEV
eukprot:g7152.t1